MQERDLGCLERGGRRCCGGLCVGRREGGLVLACIANRSFTSSHGSFSPLVLICELPPPRVLSVQRGLAPKQDCEDAPASIMAHGPAPGWLRRVAEGLIDSDAVELPTHCTRGAVEGLRVVRVAWLVHGASDAVRPGAQPPATSARSSGPHLLPSASPTLAPSAQSPTHFLLLHPQL